MKTIKSIFVSWIVVMFLITFTCLLVYLVAQQSLRLGANELPVQYATDVSIKLADGQDIKSIIPADKTDISRSLSTFVMVYDNNRNLVAASGMMGSKEPAYPKGVFDTVDRKGESRVTWQPRTGLRYATVVLKQGNMYIVGARSLKETEKLIDMIGRLVLAAWTACAVFSAIALCIIYAFYKKVYLA